jgi:hypothetical protein
VPFLSQVSLVMAQAARPDVCRWASGLARARTVPAWLTSSHYREVSGFDGGSGLDGGSGQPGLPELSA